MPVGIRHPCGGTVSFDLMRSQLGHEGEMKILTAGQMAEVDRLTSELYGVPSILLMECAGRSVTEEIAREQPRLARGRVLIFCGRGNNGGDGLVAARHLLSRGGQPEVILLCDPAQLKGDARSNWEMARSVGLPVQVAASAAERRALLKGLSAPAVVIDAIFGTGLSRPIGDDLKGVVAWINQASSRSYVVSVDIASGLFADSAIVPGAAVKADMTVTFTALKLAHVLPPAANMGGRVRVVPIGSPASLLETPEHRFELEQAEKVREVLPPRPRDSHKGTYGHVLVVAGSRSKSGAALMAGMAALRSGAGLATLALPASLRKDVVGKFPELMTEYYPETRQGTLDRSAAEGLAGSLVEFDALVVGPGLSTHPSTRALVEATVRQSPIPVILDADGINAFAGNPARIQNRHGRPIILTPHPGEMARLLGVQIAEVQKRRLEVATSCASENGLYVVLKGFQTISASPGGRAVINSTGNPGMATGGSGDILSGMMGRFVAGWWRRYRGADAEALLDHVAAAVYLHGLAGDLAAAEKGEESMIATDLLPHLAAAFRSVSLS